MQKNKKTIIPLMILSLVLVLALSACGGNKSEESEDSKIAVTRVFETAMAAITQTDAAMASTPSSTPTMQLTSTSTPTPTIEPVTTLPTLPSLPTATSVFNQPNTPNSSCDIGNFVKDVTIPDGTSIPAGGKFTKTWEIKNSGTCTWNKNYQIIFYGGDRMAENTAYKFTDDDVEPGESVQISLEMTAPATTGTFYSYWIFRNDAGQNFFVDGGSIYVQIAVGGTATQGPAATTAPTADPNNAPSITIQNDSATTITVGGTVDLSGIASDAEDGNISASIKWFIDSTEQTSTGSPVTLTFNTAGIFTVKATVTDSGGKTTTSNSITITVN